MTAWRITDDAQRALEAMLARPVELRDLVASIYLTDEDRQLPDGRWAVAWRARERYRRVYLGVVTETAQSGDVTRVIVYVWPPHAGAPAAIRGGGNKPSADCQKTAHLAKAIGVDTTPAAIRDMSHAARGELEQRILRELTREAAEQMGAANLRHWTRMRDRWTRLRSSG